MREGRTIAEWARRAAIGAALCTALAWPVGSARAVVLGEDAPGLGRHAVMLVEQRGFCSAAVVAPDVVLTAAHCVVGHGEIRAFHRDAAGAPAFLAPSGVAVHPQYDKGAVQGRRRSIDLALVRLSQPLPSGFAPVPLGADVRPAAGQVWTVGGYGLSAEGDPRTGGRFRTAEVPVIEPYGPSAILVWLKGPGRGEFTGRGACTGDFGGPIFAPDGSVGAITVWAEGAGKARCGALTQGVLVGPQRAWIEKTLAGWGVR